MRSFATTFSLASLTLAGLCAPLAAQYGISTTPLSPTGIPRSIVLAPTPIGNFAICSMTQASEQFPCNVTNPFAPTVGISSSFSQDQYCDATYTPAFGGRLVTAHRFGGIRMWDASIPNLGGPLPGLGYTATNYSHEGLKTFTDPTGVATYVLYSEQHTSPTSSGGLILYGMNPTNLSFIGQNLQVGCAGRALEVSRDGRIVWQWGDQANNQFNGVLRVFSTNGYTGNPLLLNTIAYPFTYGYPDKDLESNAKQSNLLSAMGWDGLSVINVTNVTSPVITTVIGPSQVIFVDGCTFIPATNVALVWGFVQIGTNQVDYLAFFDTTIPGVATPLLVLPAGFRVDDAKIMGNHIYCVGRDRANALAAILVVF